MLILVLCEPDAAKKVSLVCPSLVAYPNAMATITVTIFNRRRPHVFRYFRKRRFFIRFSFPSTRKRRFQAPKTGFPKRSPEWSYSLKNAGLSFSLSGRTKTDVFEYDEIIRHTAHALLGMIPTFHSFGFFVFRALF